MKIYKSKRYNLKNRVIPFLYILIYAVLCFYRLLSVAFRLYYRKGKSGRVKF